MDDDATKVEGPTQATKVEGPSEATKVERGAATSRRASAGRISTTRYRMGAPIGRGGMGEVLEAHDTQFERDVAIKRMRDESPSDARIQRFLREARIQGQLEHPSIVPIHELGRDVDGRPYFVMKKLAGTTLGDLLAKSERERPSRQRLLRAFIDVCLAIELAHTRGVIHRDIKPDNIVLGDFGETYVLDWGVAKVIGETDDAAIIDPGGVETQTGAAVGTAGYMAPEQARGEREIDARADIYALGCLLFEILAGERLHPKGAAGLASAVAGIDARPSLRAPDRDVPPELDALCVQATALEPADRVASARALADAVQVFLDGDRDLAQRRVLATQHLSRATEAFARDDRVVAMREAGRAVALDPTLPEPALLITRILVEPPREVPPQVVDELSAEDAQLTRDNARIGMLANFGYLLFLPVFAISGGVPAWAWLALIGGAVVSSALLWLMGQGRMPFARWPIVLISTSMLVVLGRVLSPFLLGIPIAALTMVGLIAGPALRLPRALGLGAIHCAAIIGLWLAERAGVVSETMHVGASSLVLHGPVFASDVATSALLCVGTIATVAASVWLAHGIRASDQAARTRVRVMSWQLKQLVT